MSKAGAATPYGIVADGDGNAWFCEFGTGSNRLGRIDAASGEITEYYTPTPNSGPRRLWYENNGNSAIGVVIEE